MFGFGGGRNREDDCAALRARDRERTRFRHAVDVLAGRTPKWKGRECASTGGFAVPAAIVAIDDDEVDVCAEPKQNHRNSIANHARVCVRGA